MDNKCNTKHYYIKHPFKKVKFICGSLIGGLK